MITDDIRRTHPTTNMDMLELRPRLFALPGRQARGDIHMIELLGINAKGIRIALDILNTHDFIQIAESADVLEKRKRLDPSELVEVACGDDGRVLVFGEEGGDEGTRGRGSPCKLDEPPLEVQCTLMVKNLFWPSRVSQAATRGLRLLDQAWLVGSMRPGLYLSSAPGRMTSASVEPPGLALRRRMVSGL
ncbi:hypothetical protein KC356_g40 [Hortaea werneckii]|nr:hypothetical protein KC356_g40 [Hortaea werneckii]